MPPTPTASLSTRLLSGLIIGTLSGLFVIVLLCIVATVYALLGPGLTSGWFWQRVGLVAAGVLTMSIVVSILKSIRRR
ncbi:MAG: hypothetical protein ACK5TV_10255 [Phycisphaerales bacterium]